MIDDDLFAIIDPVLREAGSIPEAGEDYRTPPLDVLRLSPSGPDALGCPGSAGP